MKTVFIIRYFQFFFSSFYSFFFLIKNARKGKKKYENLQHWRNEGQKIAIIRCYNVKQVLKFSERIFLFISSKICFFFFFCQQQIFFSKSYFSRAIYRNRTVARVDWIIFLVACFHCVFIRMTESDEFRFYYIIFFC